MKLRNNLNAEVGGSWLSVLLSSKERAQRGCPKNFSVVPLVTVLALGEVFVYRKKGLNVPETWRTLSFSCVRE